MINKLPLVAVLALVLSATPTLACGGSGHEVRSTADTDIDHDFDPDFPTDDIDIDNTNSTLTKRQDVRCGNGLAACPNNLCCSRAGFCGNTQFHCGAHCQTGRGRCDFDTLFAVKRDHFRPEFGWRAIFDCTESNVIALTWDDGPSQYTGPLLDLLKAEKVRGTFFVNGQHRERNGFDTRTGIWPDVLRRIVREGHQLASHTWAHVASLEGEGTRSRNEQMVWTEIMFRDILGGYYPTYMRPPHGNCGTASCVNQMSQLGYTVIIWNLDTQDWKFQPPNQPINEAWKAYEEYSRILWNKNHGSYGKTLSLSHDTLGETIGLARHMIQQAKQRGLRFVTVGECLGDWDPANWYRDAKTGQRRRP